MQLRTSSVLWNCQIRLGFRSDSHNAMRSNSLKKQLFTEQRYLTSKCNFVVDENYDKGAVFKSLNLLRGVSVKGDLLFPTAAVAQM